VYADGAPMSLLSNAWNDLHKPLIACCKAIMATPAEGLFGIAVKLAADDDCSEGEDYQERIIGVLADFERLTGGSFLAST
jgi:hypothetical protein